MAKNRSELDEQMMLAAARLDWRRFEGLARAGARLWPVDGGPGPLSAAALAMGSASEPKAIEELLRLGARLEGEHCPSLAARAALIRAPMSAIEALAKGGAWAPEKRAPGSDPPLSALAFGDWIEDGDAARRIEAIAPWGQDVEERDEAGKTALALACQRGRLASARALLAAGASPRAKDLNGATPLMWVAIALPDGAVEIAGALISAGADPAEPDAKGVSPLHMAKMKSRNGSDGGLWGLFQALQERGELERCAQEPGLISKGPAL